MNFVRVAALTELPLDRPWGLKVDGRAVVVVRTEERVFALDNVCPHAGSQFQRGRVMNGQLVCPLHAARFDLATGECNTAIYGVTPIVTHETRIVEGYLEVALSDAPVAEPYA